MEHNISPHPVHLTDGQYEITMYEQKCIRCGFEWLSRKEFPVRCANKRCANIMKPIMSKYKSRRRIRNSNTEPTHG
jgi:hypothetical protein